MADPAATVVPLAHVGHYLWILYVIPVLIVVGSIVKTTISEKRDARAKKAPLEDLGESRGKRR